jgi:hypothetical protein
MSSREKLRTARDIINNEELSHVRPGIHHGEGSSRVKNSVVAFEVKLFIRYNDFGEYTYLALFSQVPDDLFRFDNYDDVWPVKTKPHHFHERGMRNVRDSPMHGSPGNDIPLFFNAIEDAFKIT